MKSVIFTLKILVKVLNQGGNLGPKLKKLERYLLRDVFIKLWCFLNVTETTGSQMITVIFGFVWQR